MQSIQTTKSWTHKPSFTMLRKYASTCVRNTTVQLYIRISTGSTYELLSMHLHNFKMIRWDKSRRNCTSLIDYLKSFNLLTLFGACVYKQTRRNMATLRTCTKFCRTRHQLHGGQSIIANQRQFVKSCNFVLFDTIAIHHPTCNYEK